MIVGVSRRVGRLLFYLALATALPRALGPDRHVACEAFEGLSGSSLHAFKSHLSHRVQEADNSAFRAGTFKKGEYELYFHVENAILKAMNDKYFKDKELSASAVSLYEQILMKHLLANPAFRPDQIYSDYKTLRFAFANDTPALRDYLTKAYDAAATEFQIALKRYGGLKELYDFEGSAIRDPRRWHLAGFGASADQAGTAARFARYTPTKGWQDFGSPSTVDHLNKRVLSADQFRKKLHQVLSAKGKTEAFVRGESGQYLLSEPAIEILKKAGSEESGYVRDSFLRRFGLTLSEETLADLKKYYDLVETFAPSIYEAQETLSLGLHQATEGLVAADLAGQNVRNIHGVMSALAKAALGQGEGAAGRAVELARHAQDVASASFEARRAKFEDALQKAGIDGKALIFSGDDGVFYPSRDLSEAEREKFLLTLRSSALKANDFRVSFLPGKYLGSSQAIPVERRAELISKAETAEKALRRNLEIHGISYLRLKEMGIAFDLRPTETSVRVKVWMTGKVDAEIKAAVERHLSEVLPEGFEAGSVQELPPFPSLQGRAPFWQTVPQLGFAPERLAA